MACFFCSSNYHTTENCDIHPESGARILRTRNLCVNCLSESHPAHIRCTPKCHICFSPFHSHVMCIHRCKTSKLFLPKIDVMLLPRFAQLFNEVEKCSLAFSSQAALNLIPVKPLQVIRHFDNAKKLLSGEITTVVRDTFTLTKNNYLSLQSLKTISSKVPICKARKIILENLEISTNNFLLLLSSHTESLECRIVECSKNIPFVELLERIPFIRVLILDQINIQIPISWPANLMKYIRGKGLQEIYLHIPSWNFNSETLAKLVKLKGDSTFYITLFLNAPAEEIDKCETKILQHFEVLYSECYTTLKLLTPVGAPVGRDWNPRTEKVCRKFYTLKNL